MGDKVDPELSGFFRCPDLLHWSPSNSRSVTTFLKFHCPKDQLCCGKTLLATLILPPLTSVCIFSILFSIHFQRG